MVEETFNVERCTLNVARGTWHVNTEFSLSLQDRRLPPGIPGQVGAGPFQDNSSIFQHIGVVARPGRPGVLLDRTTVIPPG